MASKKVNQKDKRESGGYVALPHIILRSDAYARLSPYAVKLLNDLLSQYNGSNNGDLCIAWTLMKKRYWKSKSTLYAARDELIRGNWVEISRQGGRHVAGLYAFTFYNVDECKGKLDVEATKKPKSTWRNKNGGTGGVPISPPLAREAYQ